MIIGVVVAIIVLVSNDAYLSLVVSKNKLIYSFINGTATKGTIFIDRLSRFIFPLIIIFVLSFNYYFALLSFVLFAYQFCIMILTISAIINMYYFSGVISAIFLIIPINTIYFIIRLYFSVVCLNRSKSAFKQKYFSFGFDAGFFIKIAYCFIFVLILSLFIAFIFPILLKSAIFSIY